MPKWRVGSSLFKMPRRFFQRIAPGFLDARIHLGGREDWAEVVPIRYFVWLPIVLCSFGFP